MFSSFKKDTPIVTESLVNSEPCETHSYRPNSSQPTVECFEQEYEPEPKKNTFLKNIFSFRKRQEYATENSSPKQGFVYICKKYLAFIGPGAMTAVAYIDAGNFSSSVSAGAQYQYHLLFIMFISSCIAVFLQTLAIRLGTISGRDLAQLCREEFPQWLNLILYVFAEIAIIATDIAEVVGTAVALNILFHIPLIVGVILTIVDVLCILMLYRNGKSVKFVYYFEYGVSFLVLGVVICFAIQLSRIPPTSAGQVFHGFIPSKVIFEGQAMYAACSILGATVMPHSLYLGSSIVKPRLYERDVKLGNISSEFDQDKLLVYRPSLDAINYSLKYSVTELFISLFTFALFVNAAILIVAGATMYGTKNAGDADLYSIYDSLCELLSKGSGILFIVALLLSGQSAGIVCTIAGQIVCEGHIKWTFKPWIRRVFTRCLAIIPCLIVSACVGKSGIGQVLNASQVVLSILLPFLVLPLIYFTSKSNIMTIGASGDGTESVIYDEASNEEESNAQSSVPTKLYDGSITKSITSLIRKSKLSSAALSSMSYSERNRPNTEFDYVFEQGKRLETENIEDVKEVGAENKKMYRETGRVGKLPDRPVSYKNNWLFIVVSILVWVFITVLNVYLIVQLGMGNS